MTSQLLLHRTDQRHSCCGKRLADRHHRFYSSAPNPSPPSLSVLLRPFPHSCLFSWLNPFPFYYYASLLIFSHVFPSLLLVLITATAAAVTSQAHPRKIKVMLENSSLVWTTWIMKYEHHALMCCSFSSYSCTSLLISDQHIISPSCTCSSVVWTTDPSSSLHPFSSPSSRTSKLTFSSLSVDPHWHDGRG